MNSTYRPVVVWTAEVLWVGLLFFASTLRSLAAEPPIALHPENPHYFLWHGEPTLLITSGEHYGAVMNLDFDYVRYFDELQRNKLNHTPHVQRCLSRNLDRVRYYGKHTRSVGRTLRLPLGAQRRARVCRGWKQVRREQMGPGLF